MAVDVLAQSSSSLVSGGALPESALGLAPALPQGMVTELASLGGLPDAQVGSLP